MNQAIDSYLCQIARVQQLVEMCLNSNDLPFFINALEHTSVASYKLATFGDLGDSDQMLTLQDGCYSIELELFQECLMDLDFYGEESLLRNERALHDDKFNRLVELIRHLAKSKKYRKRFVKRESMYRSQSNQYKAYVASLFERYSKLMVLRLDLGYSSALEHSVPIDALQEHRDRFFQNRRNNQLFDHMVGNIWAMEYGQDRGPHLHLILFFDGHKVRKDVYYGLGIAEYWRTIVGEGGWAYTSNTTKEQFEKIGKCGIGLIHHHDVTKRLNLNGIIEYLFKCEQHFPFKPSKKMKTIGRGHLSNSAMLSPGRPRTRSSFHINADVQVPL